MFTKSYLSCVLGCVAGAMLLMKPGVAQSQVPTASVTGSSSTPTSTNNINQWTQVLNGGSVLYSDAGVQLRGNGRGYPVLQAVSNPFVALGDWSLEISYHYLSVANYGTGVKAIGARGQYVLMLHQDVYGQFLAINDKVVWRTYSGQAHHQVVIVKRGARWIALVDGIQFGNEPVINMPVTLQIGGGVQKDPWDWNALDVERIRINNNIIL
jgi:hypothetical protein